MRTQPLTSCEQALLLVINAAACAKQTFESLVADAGLGLNEDETEAMAKAEADEQAAMAYLQSHAAKFPGCEQAFAFQRQPKRANLYSWCGYDHDSGAMPQLAPA